MYIGAIEAGGTKFVCAIGDVEGNIIEKTSVQTRQPDETLAEVFAFFDQYPIKAMGISSFGPIGIDPNKDNYGYVLSTPKPGWSHFDFLGNMKRRYNIPFAWTTDVNGAAYGELKKGNAQGKNSCIYLTVGTGIGAGVVINGEIFSGIGHPEMGHIHLKRHPQDIDFGGTCPFHQDCLEGLAAGPSLEARTGIRGENLPEDHEVWNIQAYYIAQALMSYVLTLGPEIIILGGGVMNQNHMLTKIRQSFIDQMAGYMETPDVNEYIVRWGLPNESGIIGSILLAADLLK